MYNTWITCTWLFLYSLHNREVEKAVNTSEGLYQRWTQLLEDTNSVSKEEYDWTMNELRNSLRSIEWDVEDLEETINILFRIQSFILETGCISKFKFKLSFVCTIYV